MVLPIGIGKSKAIEGIPEAAIRAAFSRLGVALLSPGERK